ncbi:alpha beta-hydrolase [Lecanosticta acicola]|uniref:Alpha beta-hydrolase n=1 Tax=Lecanosticta acicola TaxID=111012 RepID=A0AAI8Z9J6_9PEZI|nr:alpha beta-hydrolase [Lecanosticta acicola]
MSINDMPLSIVLQDATSKATSQNLFLFPDGSGSAMAYSSLPQISPETRLIALNSPFLRQPQDYPNSIEAMAKIWLPEIRRRQPRGPYSLGGWSAGGYYGVEAARLLLAQGEIVERLVLIDSPCRLLYEALPFPTVQALADKNLMGSTHNPKRKAPAWMLDHFAVTIRAIESYVPMPLRTELRLPEVFVIWAAEGIDAAHDLDVDWSVKVNRLLLRTRKRFSPLGWDLMFPNVEVKTAALPGANHFNLIHGRHALDLVDLFRLVMGQQLSVDLQYARC